MSGIVIKQSVKWTMNLYNHILSLSCDIVRLYWSKIHSIKAFYLLFSSINIHVLIFQAQSDPIGSRLYLLFYNWARYMSCIDYCSKYVLLLILLWDYDTVNTFLTQVLRKHQLNLGNWANEEMMYWRDIHNLNIAKD